MGGFWGIIDLSGGGLRDDLLDLLERSVGSKTSQAVEVRRSGSCGIVQIRQSEDYYSALKIDHQKEQGLSWLVFDGRIDSAPWVKSSDHYTSATDTELLLQELVDNGTNVLSDLIGDFVFAWWDHASQSLLLVRDPIGVKSLYYATLDSHVIFGTQAGPLLPFISIQPNDLMICDYLIGHFHAKDETFFSHIKQVPPSCYSLARGKEVETRRYWDIQPKPIESLSQEEHAEHLRALLLEAVMRRVPTEEAFGVFLSGGLDSSSVCSLAASQGTAIAGRMVGLSAAFDVLTECDERPYIDALVNRYDFEQEFVLSDELWPLCNQMPSMIGRHDEPVLDPYEALTTELLLRAHSRNISIVLTGHGGDEAMRGGLVLPRTVRAAMHALYRKHSVQYPPFLSDYMRKIGTFRAESFASTAANKDDYIHETLLDDPSFLTFMCLNTSLSRLPVELRHPFLDRRIVEFCLSIPEEVKGTTNPKQLLRVAMKGILPNEVRFRHGKTRFLPLFDLALRQQSVNYVEQLLNSNSLNPYIDRKKFQELYKKFLAKEAQGFDEIIWKVISIGLWLNRLDAGLAGMI